jgi:hypothetical protein
VRRISWKAIAYRFEERGEVCAALNSVPQKENAQKCGKIAP